MKQWVLLWTLAPGIITGTSQPPVTAGMKKTQRWKVHIYDPMGQSPRSAASTSLPKESLSSDKKRQLIYIVCMHAKLLQTCLTLCDPMDCRPPGSSVHGILQGRILEGVAMPSFRGSSQGSNPHLLHLLHWQEGSLLLVPHYPPFTSSSYSQGVEGQIIKPQVPTKRNVKLVAEVAEQVGSREAAGKACLTAVVGPV